MLQTESVPLETIRSAVVIRCMRSESLMGFITRIRFPVYYERSVKQYVSIRKRHNVPKRVGFPFVS